MTRFLIVWALLSVPASIVIGLAIARRPCVVAPSLDERLAPHVLSDLELRVADYRITEVVEVTPTPSAWVAMSRDRWPA